ncbi:DUF2235 domain-containing protein [Billgrantia diversa]|uniref:phospholipase effector Tle1 domain-containing protein n=1 Tax=Halomonas sp. MCCC 1A13316 TaxID=2733487 RepID=UPI0018A69479|nr:DUF2235 domain-containing protein [Halomonas sp. MCCC 1A13316]QOR39126.1 DUF2235 domain-containing protein [Halomonas sp. MCCC 1A13316]
MATRYLMGQVLHFVIETAERNLEQDIIKSRTSNIGRMFLAHFWREDDELSIAFRKHYYSGLGTPFEASLSESLVGAAHRIPSEGEATRDGQLRSSVTEAAKDAASGNHNGRWWEVFGNSFKKDITQPWNWLKQARNSVVRTGAEAFAPIRDSSLAANLLMSGSHTRQSAAIQDFKSSVSDVQRSSQLPLSRIRVSVFGFDFGAALAKAFVRELLDDVCERDGEAYRYEGAEVTVGFVGLLDCVDRTHAEMGPLDWFHPLMPVLDDGGALHSGCQCALHLIAAHERRFYRRCRPLGGHNANWREELCPGISEDIGGGLVSDEQKNSAELSRATLHRMYRQATRAGVPFPSLERLREKDAMTAQLFELNDRIEGYSLMAMALHYRRETSGHRSPTVESFRFHTLIYLAWLALRYRDYREALAILENREDALPNRYYNHTLGAVTSSLTMDSDQWEREEAERADIDAGLADLKAKWGWLEQVDSEAQHIRSRFNSPDSNTRRHARAVLRENLVLAENWHRWTREESPPELLEPIDLLFAYGLHDKQPEEMAYRNRQPNQSSGGYRFMTYRDIDRPEEGDSANEIAEMHPRERVPAWTAR